MRTNKTNDPMMEALQAMFLAFPSQERDGHEREMGKLYILAVEGINRGFVAMACKRFIQGQVPRQNFTWRPTPAELATEARRLQDAARETERVAKMPGPRARERIAGPRQPFTPYPNLWDSLAGEPAMIKALQGMTFDGMTAMSKLMATEGIEAVKTKLRSVAAAPDREKAA